jgi:hypothetical protein
MVSVALQSVVDMGAWVDPRSPAASNAKANSVRSINQLTKQPQADNRARIKLATSYTTSVQVQLPEQHPLRFRFPTLTLHVSDADEDGIYVATDTFSHVYGEGETGNEAVGDYLASVLDHLLDLEMNEGNLAPGLQRDLENMRRYIIRVR